MNKINVTTVSAVATSATAVQAVIPEYQKSKAVIRRFQVAEAPEKELVFPGLTINISQYTVTYMGKPLEMPPREIELLYFLASHPGMVFTREQLLEQVWGYDYFGDSRTVDVHVKRLREKLSGGEELGWQIKTVWGVGYKFEVK